MLNNKQVLINYKTTGAIYAGMTIQPEPFTPKCHQPEVEPYTPEWQGVNETKRYHQKKFIASMVPFSTPIRWSHLPGMVEPYTPEYSFRRY